MSVTIQENTIRVTVGSPTVGVTVRNGRGPQGAQGEQGEQGLTGDGSGDMLRSLNLSDLASASTARTNLGLGALATVTPGTGVETALAINVGSAGAPVLFNGALGAPTSGTATNITGLPIATGVSGLGTGVATFLATPSSANLLAAVTDETGSNSGAKLVFSSGPEIYAPIFGFSDGSFLQSKWEASTLIAAPQAGGVEYDGGAFYGTPNASNRGVFCSEHFVVLTSSNTLANSTSAQAIFDGGGGPANGALTLPTGTYFFEMLLDVSGLSGSAHTISFSVAGTATIGTIKYQGTGFDSAAVVEVGNSTAATQIGSSGTTSTTLAVQLSGIFTVTVTGTIIPQITQGTASAAANVLIGSFFKCHRVGTSSVATVGNWS